MSRIEKSQLAPPRYEELEARLHEAEETLRAIRSGEIDALVVSGPAGEQVYTLKTSEHLYRVLVEAMNEGALTLSQDGTILYCNQSFATLLNKPSERILGSVLHQFVITADLPRLGDLLKQCQATGVKGAKGEITLFSEENGEIPTQLSLSPLPSEDAHSVSIIVTDLTEQKRQQELVASEKLLRSILEQAAEATVVCDEHGTIIHASRRTHELCACNPVRHSFDEVLLLHISPAEQLQAHPEEKEIEAVPEQLSFSSILDHMELQGVEAVFHRPDGQVVDLLLSAGLILDFRGKTLGCVVTMMDITERKRAGEAIRASERQLRLVTDNIPVFIVYCDAEGRYQFVNKSYAERFGLVAEQILGKRISEVVGAEAYARFSPYVDQVLTGQAVEFEVEVPYATIGRHYMQCSYVPDINVQGEVRGFYAMLGDITERKEAEAERERMLAREQKLRLKAEEASRLKDEFLAVVSHELKTPLNAINGWAELLRGGLLSGEQKQQAIETVARNAKAQGQIIDDLLDMSRIITGKMRLNTKNLSLANVIQAAVETVRHAAEARKIRLEVMTDPQSGVVVGDFDRLQQVVWNLLSNAIKFTSKGGLVRIKTSQKESQVEIAVSDTGQGIKPGFLPYVFDRFRQEDATTRRQHGGLGLGLAIVRQLVELHGGSVQAESAGEGQGTTFKVILPLRGKNSGALSQKDRNKIKPAQPLLRNGLAGSISGIRVLLVDDELDTLVLTKLILENGGAEVKTADSAAEGYRLFAEWKPNVIISDIGMAHEDGYDFLRHVRERDKVTPAVALTAYTRTEDRIQAFSAGFQMHVSKPVEPEELLAVVASLLKPTGK